MKPLVEAVVADETGMMKATFFNQPWLARKYPKGTRLVLHGKLAARNAFRVEGHAPTSESTGGGQEVAHYPATIGLSSTQILALVRAHLDAAHDAVDPLPARARRLAGLPDRAAALVAAHAGDLEGGRRRLAFDELLLAQLSLLRRRAQRRAAGTAPVLDQPPSLTVRWREELLPFTLTGDQRAAIAVLDGELAAAAADAAPAHGGGRLGQDRRRAARDPARGRARRAGRLHGADRGARRAALRDAAGADAGRGGAHRAAHRLDDAPSGAPTR